MTQGRPSLEEAPVAVQPASHLIHGVLHFLRIARLRKNILFGALVIFTVLGGLYYASATRFYEAKASLLIRQNGKRSEHAFVGSRGRQPRHHANV